jgi:hypothetical protein
MKRLVWLLLLAFGTATAQVQPVDVRLFPEEKCCCCADGANACDMASDCAPAPTSCAQPALQLQSPAQAVAKRALPAPQAAREKFYARFLSPARIAPVLPVVEVAAPAASVPLFRAHCSFLI